MTFIVLMFYAGGVYESEFRYKWGFWASIFWPWYAGKVAFNCVARELEND